jgi:hypothetical protein
MSSAYASFSRRFSDHSRQVSGGRTKRLEYECPEKALGDAGGSDCRVILAVMYPPRFRQ